MSKRYRHAALGGTFDRLHRGHQHLLDTAFDQAESVTIGVTQPDLNHSKHLSTFITDYSQRVEDISHYLKSKNCYDRAHLISLTDVYGTTLTDPTIDLLVVSPQTVSGAKKVNQERQKRHMPPLPVKISDMIKDESGEYLSSTRIRQGLVNRQGRVYHLLFQQDLVLSEDQKVRLKKPQGTLHPTLDQIPENLFDTAPQLIAIGDMVTRELALRDTSFHLAIIDGHIQRQPVGLPDLHMTFMHSQNPAGIIKAKTALLIKDLIQGQEPAAMVIEGEEDLLGFPAVLAAPLGSILLYGQPFQGIVVIDATEEKKEELAQFINPSFGNKLSSK